MIQTKQSIIENGFVGLKFKSISALTDIESVDYKLIPIVELEELIATPIGNLFLEEIENAVKAVVQDEPEIIIPNYRFRTEYFKTTVEIIQDEVSFKEFLELSNKQYVQKLGQAEYILNRLKNLCQNLTT